MQLSSETKHKIQLVLLLAIAIAAARSGYILYQRHVDKIESAKKAPPPLEPDYYVTPKKLHPYDLQSTRELTRQPVWVKEGYRYTCYAYDRARRHTDFSRPQGTLLPIERLEIKDVVMDTAAEAPGQHLLMALFERNGRVLAVQVGVEKDQNFQIYSDEIFYIQDPHELYKHWPADVWDSVARHEVKPGMNELQADFAIGMGIPERSGDPAVKTVNYPNDGKPLRITYRDGKAEEIKPGPTA
ncbi:MAG: hypothetical protein LAO03_12820 [Acidobacteriia bacterium]|nr:hypothetical protein [Terriglobia bacterium]